MMIIDEHERIKASKELAKSLTGVAKRDKELQIKKDERETIKASKYPEPSKMSLFELIDLIKEVTGK